MRASGILMHISSLPSPYGIGTFGKSAYEFVGFLIASKQKYWQILPLGPTSYGDSPYSSFSTFAGNPYFIDLDILCEEGALFPEECNTIDWGDDLQNIDFKKMFDNRYQLLRMAYQRQKDSLNMTQFREENQDWLEDFAFYMALKFEFNLVSWFEWDDDIKKREPQAMNFYKQKLNDEIDFFVYTQYKFFEQWNKLKAYANENGIQIIGDIPIYVAGDSSDTWSNSDLFLFDDTLTPVDVAGCPPDAFSATGQLWGNPLYRWEKSKETNYEWWTRRVKSAFQLYDMVRIDHFRGFESYYAIPYGDKTAEFGEWRQGPGIDIFEHFKKELGDLPIIAEDLGYLTDGVRTLLAQSGYPGMKVLQFAFDSREESDYLPHNYQKHCVVYTGTHDNETLSGWFYTAPKDDIDFAIRYLHLTKEEGYNQGFIRQAYMSVGNLVVVPIQDYLELGCPYRMNTPSTLGKNWRFRLAKNALTNEVSERIAKLVTTYCR